VYGCESDNKGTARSLPFGAGITKLGRDRNDLFWQNEPSIFNFSEA
jgi:hypothetical protein